MSETDFDIHYTSGLARINLDPDEEVHLGTQLKQILEFVETLKQLDVSGVEPTSHAFPLINVLREDLERPSLSHEEAMQNAPNKANGLFVVPKIVE